MAEERHEACNIDRQVINENINSISEYLVEGRGVRQAIIEQFEN
jgi:hypothetical protein